MSRAGISKGNSKELPVLYLMYHIEGKPVTTAIQSSQYLWEYYNEDETQTQIIGDSFFHPLAIVDLLPKIEIPEEMKRVKVSFSIPPNSYNVRYWPDRYAGNKEAELSQYKDLKIVLDTFTIPNDEKGFIVQIYAVWPQGEAYYSLYITKSAPENTHN
jgi:hypothetical protein